MPLRYGEDALSMDGLPESVRIEMAAHLALMGWIQDPDLALIQLLQSDAPIPRYIREWLADALGSGNATGIRLVVTKPKKQRAQFVASASRQKWLKIGKWMRDTTASGKSRADALELAAAQFHLSPETCDKALIYFDRFKSWADAFLEANAENGAKIEGAGGFAYLEFIFVARDVARKPLDKRDNPFAWPV